ncbi:Macrolide export ATP-binding/permease protein MacB [Corynebacterium faecale]|uniref:ABC transporter permease n=1 Tax=Corynebacterium faecale TaxID=1758466 RepID=UPI0025B528BA|nr:ABC transporter permease [Corynebacterium faecale]WJY91261.1 Macrolide export ATP-binding/permease protein MacB [Corynebacterium faecale]
MFLAWRDMLFARTRFLLMGLVLGLMSILIVIISGLTAGLTNDGISGLKALEADVVAFEEGTQTDSAFTRSVVNVNDADILAQADGVEEATPMGLSLINARNQEGTPIDLTLVGVDPDSFIAPEGLPAISADRMPGQPTPTAHETIVSGTLADSGIALGDTITVDRLEIEFTVTGFTDDQRTFGHVDLAYVPMDTWQEVHAGARAGEAPAERSYEEASVIVANAPGVDLEALAAETGLDTRSLKQSYDSSPGYTAETMTLTMIEWFLYIITALVTGAFFLVWTIQRSADISVMRAIGATRGFLLRDSLGQAVVILALSIIVGVSLAVGLGLWLETTAMPFATEWQSVLGGAAMLFISGLIGAFIAVYRVTKTDPLTALGENR